MRDDLLVAFFETIGLNARKSDLFQGGRLLIVPLALTLAFTNFRRIRPGLFVLPLQSSTGISKAAVGS
ncbi:hypothetical protein ACS3SW_10985 [Roseobacteraceae bacterium S113]